MFCSRSQSEQTLSSVSSLLQSCHPLHQHSSFVTVSVKRELKSNWIRLHCFCLLLWWCLMLRVVRGQTSLKLSTWERGETLLSPLLFNYLRPSHAVYTRFCQRAERSETVGAKPDWKEPFLCLFNRWSLGQKTKFFVCSWMLYVRSCVYVSQMVCNCNSIIRLMWAGVSSK